MTYPYPQPPKPKKRHRGLKITGAIVGGFVVLGVAAGIAGGSGTPAASTTSTPTAGCFTPTGAPPATYDGTTVTWNKQLCTWVMSAPAKSTPVAPTTTAPQFSPQVEQARDKAQSYLDLKGFSRDGLVGQLTFEQFPKDVAEQAVDSLGVDWNGQAAKAAADYLDFTSFSCSGLIAQLDSSAADRFTKAQATYGAHQTAACK